jgi:hypothetical protein
MPLVRGKAAAPVRSLLPELPLQLQSLAVELHRSLQHRWAPKQIYRFEVTPQPQSGVRSDGALAFDDLIDPAWRHTNIFGHSMIESIPSASKSPLPRSRPV